MMIDRDYNDDEYIYANPIDVPTVLGMDPTYSDLYALAIRNVLLCKHIDQSKS